MERVCVEGCWVPAPLAAAFRSRENTPFREKTPFSYSQPNPGGPTLHRRICVPKVLPIVPLEEEEMSAQPVHLQYNSPMQLYSKETAEEQFQQQIGTNSPIPLPTADKHFDPAKSATLRYLKEGDHSNFGSSFAEKIAEAEAPKVPYNDEPGWARYAREKSERARSRTPADPLQRRSPAVTPTPHHVHHENPWEHAEKSRTFTHSTHPDYRGPAYYQVQHQDHHRRGQSVGATSERGYEYGGMDFTKGLPIEKGASDYYYESHRSRKEEHERARPGYELGGTDFGKGYVAPGPYHGHGPDPPRLRPHYSADPHSPCNVYCAPNVEGVDANLLVGDTLSNQKIRHEVRHIDHSHFGGTSFAPPGGFKRDHITVRRTPPPTEPVTFSVSAKRSASAGGGYHQQQYQHQSSAPPEQQNVWRQRQADVDREVTVERLLSDEAVQQKPLQLSVPYWQQHSLTKHESWKRRSDPRLDRHEIYTQEPNWSRTVQQRKGAWERKAFDTEARVGLPASAKVPPTQPPAWHQSAQQKHAVWQSAADHMQSAPATQQYQTAQQEYQQYQAQQQQQQQYQQQQQSQQQQSYQQQQQSYQQTPAPVNASYTTSSHSYAVNQSGNNAPIVANTGFNQNQMEYLASHRDKYDAGHQYAGGLPTGFTTSSRFGGSSQQYGQEQRFSAHSETVKEQPIFQDFNIKYSTRQSEEIIEPVSTGIRAGTFSKVQNGDVVTKESKSESREEKVIQNGSVLQHERVHEIKRTPSPYFAQETMKSSEESSKTAIPLQAPVQTQYQESSYQKSSHEETTTQQSIPLPAPIQTQYQESSYQKSSQEETRNQPIPLPVQSQFQQSYQKSSTHEERSIPAQPVQQTQQYQASSYQKSSSTHEEKSIPVQPVQTQFQESYQKSSSSSHEERTIPAQPVQTQAYQASYQKSSSTTHEEKSIPVKPVVQSQQYQASSFQKSSSTHEEKSIPVQPVQTQYQASSYKKSTSTHEEKSIPVQPAVQTQFQNSRYYKSSSTREERSPIPVQPIQSQFQESHFNSSRSFHENRALSVPPPTVQSHFQDSAYNTFNSSHREHYIPVVPVNESYFKEQRYHRASSVAHHEQPLLAIQPSPVQFQEQNFRNSFHEQRTLPVQPPAVTQYQESSYKKSSSTHEERSIPVVQPVTTQFQQSYRKSTSSTEERSVPVQPQPVQTQQFQESYQKSSSSAQESRAIPVQPVQQSQQYQQSYQKSSSSTQETRAAPVVAAQPVTQYQESYKKSTRTEESSGAPLQPVQPIQTSFQESSFQKSSSNVQETQPRFESSGLLSTHGGSGYSQSVQSQQLHSPGSYKSFHSSHYSKQETTTSSTKGGDTYQPQVTTVLPVTKNTSYSYSSQSVNQPQQPTQIQQSSTTNHTQRQETQRQTQQQPVFTQPAGERYHAESRHSYKREEETSSRPTSQLSHYSQHSSYNKKREERTETKTIPAQPLAPLSAAQGAENVYSKIEMNETLPLGSLSNTQSNTQGGYRDQEGHDVSYKKDFSTAADPGKEYSLLKEEEKRVVETPLEPGVISRHVTTKYYKKKTVTDTTTTTEPDVAH